LHEHLRESKSEASSVQALFAVSHEDAARCDATLATVTTARDSAVRQAKHLEGRVLDLENGTTTLGGAKAVLERQLASAMADADALAMDKETLR
jgi:hypothetical protein